MRDGRVGHFVCVVQIDWQTLHNYKNAYSPHNRVLSQIEKRSHDPVRGGVSKGREGRILWKLHSWFEFLYLFFISVVYQLTQDVSISFMFPLGIFFSIVNFKPLVHE